MESPIGTAHKTNPVYHRLYPVKFLQYKPSIRRMIDVTQYTPGFRNATPLATHILPLQGRCQLNIDFTISPSMLSERVERGNKGVSSTNGVAMNHIVAHQFIGVRIEVNRSRIKWKVPSGRPTKQIPNITASTLSCAYKPSHLFGR